VLDDVWSSADVEPREFNMLLWMPLDDDRIGDIVFADSTIFPRCSAALSRWRTSGEISPRRHSKQSGEILERELLENECRHAR